MEAIKHLQRRYCGGALTTAVVMGLAAYMAGWPSVTRGLLLGSLFSALNFILLARGLTHRMAGGHRPAPVRTLFARLGRYLLWAVPVVLAVKLPAVDLPAAIAGVFMVPVCIVLDSAITLVREKKSPLI
jgi:hypothetical protein